MWTPSEREELAVWADRLQVEGDPFGELIAASLLAEEIAHHDPSRAASLRGRVETLERTVRDPAVARALDGCARIELGWRHGVVVALRIADGYDAAEVDPALRRLLKLPALRFLRTVRVGPTESRSSSPIPRLPAPLVEPGVLARPWTVILGRRPSSLANPVTLDWLHRTGTLDLDDEGAQAIERWLDPRRELRWLFAFGRRVELPWQRGDKGARIAAARRLLEGELVRDRRQLTRYARALWDRSLRVRMLTLDRLPLLGAEAAPFIPALLLKQGGEWTWRMRARDTVERLARNPELVAAVAEQFTADQPQCAEWLSIQPLAVARRAIPRLEAMLAAAPVSGRHQLEQALRRLDAHDRTRRRLEHDDPRNPLGRPLLTRLRRLMSR